MRGVPEKKGGGVKQDTFIYVLSYRGTTPLQSIHPFADHRSLALVHHIILALMIIGT